MFDVERYDEYHLDMFYFSDFIEEKDQNVIIYSGLNGLESIILQPEHGLHVVEPVFIPGKIYEKTNKHMFFVRDCYHRINGPALFYESLLPTFAHITLKNNFYFHGKPIPSHLPHFVGDDIINGVKPTKDVILQAMMFDRDYGILLKNKIKNIINVRNVYDEYQEMYDVLWLPKDDNLINRIKRNDGWIKEKIKLYRNWSEFPKWGGTL